MPLTLEELNEDLQHLKDAVIATKEEIAKAERAERHKKEAEEIYSVYSSFVMAGFTPEQAWEMLITLTKNNKN